MRILHLYRPRLPGLRAQAIQVLHSCHALAARGHEVTLLCDRGPGDARPEVVLQGFSLEPLESLRLEVAPFAHSGLAGLWFRHRLRQWWKGPPGLVLARDKRRLVQAVERLGAHWHRLVLETHELDSLLAQDRGEDPLPVRRLEEQAAQASTALVANCGGTLQAWQDAGFQLPRLMGVIHNGTAVRPVEGETEPVIRCVGSLRAWKGVEMVREAAPRLPLPLEWIGGSDPERAAVQPMPGLRLLPPVPYPLVPALLGRSRALLVPLEDNRFGRSFTSPLKLWDALASGRPVIAPALPAVLEIEALAGVSFHRYQPGDPGSLIEAARRAVQAEAPPAFVRSWGQRAAELEALLLQVEAG